MENFAAFLSYVRADDEHDNGRITRLCQMIEAEVQAVTGESFEIFQDDQDIHWGQKWQERLNATLDGTTFLILAVTPRYLRRPACRAELQRFLQRERELGRKDLILSIHYIDTPALSDESLRSADALAQVLAARQMLDWRDLRHEPHTNPDVCRRIEKMAREIEKAMRRTAAPAPKPAPKAEVVNLVVSAPAMQESEARTAKILPRTEPTELVVDPFPRRGDYTRIMDAVNAAEPGTRILIRPGLYKEALVLDKVLELFGDGEQSEIIVETSGADVVLFKTEFGRVSNLTLRQTGSGDLCGVNIIQGNLELEDCDITGHFSACCVAIHDGGDPRLRRNRIHDGTIGVYIYDNGKGTLEDNDIFANTSPGVNIELGGDPTVRRNRIYGNKYGVSVLEKGKGILEDNDIYANRHAGVNIFGGDPRLRHNRIHDGEAFGVVVDKNGGGTLEDNDIFSNPLGGLVVQNGGMPVVYNNRITKNDWIGIHVYHSGGGTFENNDLRENKRPWDIDESSQSRVTKSGNIEK